MIALINDIFHANDGFLILDESIDVYCPIHIEINISIIIILLGFKIIVIKIIQPRLCQEKVFITGF